MTTIYCPTCRQQRPVEQPPCVDDHVECPEWICLACDTAVVAGWLVTDAPRPADHVVHAAA